MSLTDEAFAHHQAGRLPEAETLYQKALASDGDDFQALQLLGTLTLRLGRVAEAVPLLERASGLLQGRGDQAQRHASLYNNLGLAFRMAGRREEAIAAFRHGLTLDANLPEIHTALGSMLVEQGSYHAASECLEHALRLNPQLVASLCDLGTIYAKMGRTEESIHSYRRALAVDPAHWASAFNLAQMLRQGEKFDEAIELLSRLLAISPDNLSVHSQLGVLYSVSLKFNLALDHFDRVLRENPDDAEALQYVANIQLILGKPLEANENFRRSLALRPLITLSATRSPPLFRTLMLFAPGAGNTPLGVMSDRAGYEHNILNVLPGVAYDLDMLRAQTDVVVNLISDVDQSHAILLHARDLADRLEKPTVNHPAQILKTDREAIASLLADVPGAVMPRTHRYVGSDFLSDGFDEKSFGLLFPCLVRPTGTHGGKNFEKLNSRDELRRFVQPSPEMHYYLTNYVDYRSSDGYFRKYRFIFVNDEILPYHLAIDDKWKIHHVTTDMANQVWMQNEEKAYVENPTAVFGVSQYNTLRVIKERVGLQYFGIDCGLDTAGRVVIFEVNASMLVHQNNEAFPYKIEPVRRIRAAYDAMLYRMVTENGRTAC